MTQNRTHVWGIREHHRYLPDTPSAPEVTRGIDAVPEREPETITAYASQLLEMTGSLSYTLVRWKFRWDRDGVGPRWPW